MKRPLVILPTLDERENVERIVPAVCAALPGADVLIVDDRSTDGTGELADALAAADRHVHVEHRDGPRGLGPAYLHGFRWALARDFDPILQMDADFSHRPAYLPSLLRASSDADLVLGSRYVPGGGIEGWAPHRRALSRGGNLYARYVLGAPIHDLTGGYKCFRRGVLAAIDLGNIRSVGYGFQIEMTIRALQAGFRVVEVPIVFPDRERGSSKMSVATFREALVGVWRMRGVTV